MLLELHIANFTIIESMKIEFSKGLNVLTGETGAGKSIIVDSLEILMGKKVNSSLVRKGSEKCEITGVFDSGNLTQIKSFFQAMSLPVDGDDEPIILRRTIDSQGKSKSYINDRPVQLSTLANCSSLLVEIHGQHEHQRLLKSSEQMVFLDRYADNESLRKNIEKHHFEWQEALREKELSVISDQEKEQKIDLYQFQLNEIDASSLSSSEDIEELEKTLPQLKNAEKIRVMLDQIYHHLYDAEGSILERLEQSQSLLLSSGELGVDAALNQTLLEESKIRLTEAAHSIEKLRDGTSQDPAKVDEVLSKIDQLSRLRKKYGKSIPEILEYRKKIAEELGRLENHAESVQELEKKIDGSVRDLMKLCKALRKSREKTSLKLSTQLEKSLKDLGFLKARFSIDLISHKDENGREIPSVTGTEKVEFLFSANPGEDLKPLKNIASGGECSRVMLALKKILADVDDVPSLVFDEVDSGIGGSMGHVVGEKLKNLSQHHQLLAITHLPQIAAFADRQFVVRKNVVDRRTMAEIEILEKERRVREIARMLGGAPSLDDEPTPTSLKHASELLGSAAE